MALKNILIVNPLFGDLFINSSREILKDQFVVDEFFIPGKAKKKSYSKLFHKIINILNIQLLKKRDYYQRLHKKGQDKYYSLCLKNIKNKKYDKILFCRGDRIPDFVLQQLYTQGKQLINYQCDGVEMCPDIFSKSRFFSSIFSFDKEDIIKYPELKLRFITNFYLENYNEIIDVEHDLYYIGVGLQERIEVLENLKKDLPRRNMLLMVGGKQNHDRPSSIIYTDGISYKENLNNVVKSKCLIDIKINVHNGLSFRFFEALYYQKKIITNNSDVINYEFYHPDNIMVVDYNDIDAKKISAFLDTDYIQIDQLIVQRYSFKVWLKRILEIETQSNIVY